MVRTMSGEPDSEYGACRATYDIKKLRANGIVRKIGGSRRYEPLPEGLRAVIALVVLRETVIRPLLAASTRPETHSKLSNPPPIDQHYGKPQSRHAQPLYGTWCGRLRIHSLFFIPSDKGQTGARIVSRCEGTATLRHNRILHQCIIMSRSLPASERVFVLTVQQSVKFLRMVTKLFCDETGKSFPSARNIAMGRIQGPSRV
jgi:hypothetical protein